MQSTRCDVFPIPELLIEFNRQGKWFGFTDLRKLSPRFITESLHGLQETPERYYYLQNFVGLVRVSYREPSRI